MEKMNSYVFYHFVMKFSEDFKNHRLKSEKVISYVFYHFVMKFSVDFKNHLLKLKKKIDFFCILSSCDEIK